MGPAGAKSCGTWSLKSCPQVGAINLSLKQKYPANNEFVCLKIPQIRAKRRKPAQEHHFGGECAVYMMA
jgi:hypothetical protein